LYEQALDMLPATAVTERGIMHNQLGNIYDDGGNVDRSLHHYRLCIRFHDETDDKFNAGRTRFNVAITLLNAGRLVDAHVYAEAALANYRTFGDRATDRIQKAERLIAEISQAIENMSRDHV
jgi:tetratricopeptide (TPR) repeat protein